MSSSEDIPNESSMKPAASSEQPFNVNDGDRRVKNTKGSPNRRVSDADWNRYTQRIRDVFFFALGIAGTTNQLFFATPPNPVLFPILAALLGTPFALALDQRRREANDKK